MAGLQHMAPTASIIILLRTDVIVLMALLTLLVKCIHSLDNHFPFFFLVLRLMALPAVIGTAIIVRVGMVTVDTGQPISPDLGVDFVVKQDFSRHVLQHDPDRRIRGLCGRSEEADRTHNEQNNPETVSQLQFVLRSHIRYHFLSLVVAACE